MELGTCYCSLTLGIHPAFWFLSVLNLYNLPMDITPALIFDNPDKNKFISFLIASQYLFLCLHLTWLLHRIDFKLQERKRDLRGYSRKSRFLRLNLSKLETATHIERYYVDLGRLLPLFE